MVSVYVLLTHFFLMSLSLAGSRCYYLWFCRHCAGTAAGNQGVSVVVNSGADWGKAGAQCRLPFKDEPKFVKMAVFHKLGNSTFKQCGLKSILVLDFILSWRRKWMENFPWCLSIYKALNQKRSRKTSKIVVAMSDQGWSELIPPKGPPKCRQRHCLTFFTPFSIF